MKMQPIDTTIMKTTLLLFANLLLGFCAALNAADQAKPASDDKGQPSAHIQEPNPVMLWSGEAPPKADAGGNVIASELQVLKNARFSVIKPYEFQKDGYRFLHGVALIWHKGKLYASFGHNKGGEHGHGGGSLPRER